MRASQRVILIVICAVGAASIGCARGHRARGGPTGVDGDAAIGDRGPRRTGTIRADAPSLETNTADRENDPMP